MPRNTSKRKSRRPNRKRRQRGAFLKRYNFAYAGRDTVNQLSKVAPEVIKAACEFAIEITCDVWII